MLVAFPTFRIWVKDLVIFDRTIRFYESKSPQIRSRMSGGLNCSANMF